MPVSLRINRGKLFCLLFYNNVNKIFLLLISINIDMKLSIDVLVAFNTEYLKKNVSEARSYLAESLDPLRPNVKEDGYSVNMLMLSNSQVSSDLSDAPDIVSFASFLRRSSSS